MQWKSTSSPRANKACMSRSKFKAMLIVFFDVQGLVMAGRVPSGPTVNQQYYIKVLTKLSEHVRKKRPELWRNGWILHQDNVPAHNALSVKQFLANKTSLCLSTHPTHQTSLSATSASSQRSSQCPKEPILCQQKMWKQKRGTASRSLQNMTCGIALNIGSFVCSCVSTQKGTILKAVIVDFLNLLNRKSYRQSHFFVVVSDHLKLLGAESFPKLTGSQLVKKFSHFMEPTFMAVTLSWGWGFPASSGEFCFKISTRWSMMISWSWEFSNPKTLLASWVQICALRCGTTLSQWMTTTSFPFTVHIRPLDIFHQ